MLIPLGFLAGSGGVPLDTSYELIETQILGSSQASITFSNLGDYSATYKHLQIRLTGRTDRAATNDVIRARFNSDTTTSYRAHNLYGTGSSVASTTTSASYIEIERIAGNTATASAFGAIVIDLLDVYSTTKNTTIRALGGQAVTNNLIALTSGAWFNTSSLTTINLTAIGSFAIGSRFSLYGIKG